MEGNEKELEKIYEELYEEKYKRLRELERRRGFYLDVIFVLILIILILGGCISELEEEILFLETRIEELRGR